MMILALDPGFSAFGWAIIERSVGKEDTVSEINVIRTKKSAKKKRILANEDNFARGREISSQLIAIIKEKNIAVVTVEAFSAPVKASRTNLIKIGMPYGMLIMMSEVFKLSVVMSTPQHIKKVVCGSISASKEAVEATIAKKYHGSRAVERFKQAVPESMRNHGWDALATYEGAKDSDVMRALFSVGW